MRRSNSDGVNLLGNESDSDMEEMHGQYSAEFADHAHSHTDSEQEGHPHLQGRAHGDEEQHHPNAHPHPHKKPNMHPHHIPMVKMEMWENPHANKKINELPRSHFTLIVAFVTALSFNGGFINGVSISGFFGVGLTHLTGTTTKAAASMFVDTGHPWYYYWWLILSYTAGATLCGLIVGDKRTKFRGRQASILAIEAAFLWVAYAFIVHDLKEYSQYLITFSCGLQNASTSTMLMAVIRTTNVTGTVVDFGLALGQCIRYGVKKYIWKVVLWFCCFMGFWLGGVLGTLGFQNHGMHIMAVPVVIATFFALLIGLRAFVITKRLISEKMRRNVFFAVLN